MRYLATRLAVAVLSCGILTVASGSSVAGTAQASPAWAGLDIQDELLCTFDTSVLPEVSGIAHSRTHPDIVWATNDSFNGPYLYAVDTSDCRIRATLHLIDTPARDFEALAAGVDSQGRTVIWVGDIGDNQDGHPYARILKVLEPEELEDADVAVTTYRFTYPGGPANAEALIAAPDRERLWVVTKNSGKGGTVFELPSPMSPSKEPMRATALGSARPYVTDAAMAPDGRHYVVRDYFSAEVFAGTPMGRPQARFRLPLRLGGEAITWTPDSSSVIVASEGSGDLIRVSVPEVALGRDSGIAAALPLIAGFDIYPYVRLSVATIAGIVGLVSLMRWRRRRRRRIRAGDVH